MHRYQTGMEIDTSFLAVSVIITVFAGLILANTSPTGLFSGATSDLAVTNIYVQPNPIPVGTDAAIEITVKNKGDTRFQSSEPVELILTDATENTHVGVHTFTELGPGDEHVFTFTYPQVTPAGTHTFHAALNPENTAAIPGDTADDEDQEDVIVEP